LLSRTQIVLLAGFSALAPIATDMYLPAIPALAADLRVTAAQAGQSVSVFFLGMAFGQLAAGPMSDRWGRRPLSIGGLALFTLTALLASATSSFPLMLVARTLQAFGACAAMVSARAIVSERVGPADSARLFSLLALISGLAPVLGPLLGAALVHSGQWRIIFYVMAGLGAAIGLGTLAWMPESRSAATAAQARAEHPLRAYWTLLSNRRLLGYLAAAAFNTAVLFTYIANSPAVLMGAYKASTLEFSLLFAANALGLMAASQINRRLLRTRTPEQLLRGSARNAVILAALFGLFAATGWGGKTSIIVLLFLGVSSFTPVQANAMAAGLAAGGLRPGSTAALFGAIGFAIGAIASGIAALSHDHAPQSMSMVIAACLLGSAAAIFFLVQRPSHAVAQA
jgi:DHA1 family bicyclomycin/chloramphenicol resistance-like MFS transporter